jgi:hypothetical protein
MRGSVIRLMLIALSASCQDSGLDIQNSMFECSSESCGPGGKCIDSRCRFDCEAREQRCSDGRDDDCNRLIDCADPACGCVAVPDAGGIDAGGIDAGGIDAGGIDAGSTDAGSTDAGSTDAGILYSQSFETLDTTALRGSEFIFETSFGTTAMASIDTAQAANSSARSLRLDIGPRSDDRLMWSLPIAQAPHFFLRFYMLAPQSSAELWTWVNVAGSVQRTGIYNSMPFEAQIRFGSYLDRHTVSYETPGFYTSMGPQSNCSIESNISVPAQWVCLEYEFDAQRRIANAWANSTLLSRVSITETPTGATCGGAGAMSQWLFPSVFRIAKIGMTGFASAGPSRTVWFDDVVVSTTRVGCR